MNAESVPAKLNRARYPQGMDFSQLYRDVVLEHNRAPRHQGLPPHCTHRAVGDNPLCGDRLEIGLELKDGRITGIGYEIEASALTVACCSILCELLADRALDEARSLSDRALDLFTRNPARQPDQTLAGLNALIPVLDYPNRIKTITLPLATMRAALAGRVQASTDLNPRGEEQLE